MGRWIGRHFGARLLIIALATVLWSPATVETADNEWGPDPTPREVPLDSASAFLTAALATLFGRDQSVVFVSPLVHNKFAGEEVKVTGDLHGGFRFAVSGSDPNPTHVCAQLHVYDYVIYNFDGNLKNIYADVDSEKSGFGNVSSVYPWTVKGKFEAAVVDMERDLGVVDWDAQRFYAKYIPLFFPLNIQLHSNLLIPSEAGVHGQLYNQDELYVRNNGHVTKFPLKNTPFIASGAEFVDRTTGDLLLTVDPGWKPMVTSIVRPNRLPKLSKAVVEMHLPSLGLLLGESGRKGSSGHGERLSCTEAKCEGSV